MTNTRVTQADVDDVILREHFFTVSDIDGAAFASILGPQPIPGEVAGVTICLLILKNGMKIIGCNTGPIDRSTFSAEYARKDARQKAEDQIWLLLGYQLRERLHAAAVIPPVAVQPGGLVLPDIRTLPDTYTPPEGSAK